MEGRGQEELAELGMMCEGVGGVKSGGKGGRVGCCTDRKGRPKAVDVRLGGPIGPPQELAITRPICLFWLDIS